MTTFISYVRKSLIATIPKPSPEHWVRIESSYMLVEMSPTSRGATIDENWKGTAGTEVIAQIISDLISAEEGPGVKSDDHASDDIPFSRESKAGSSYDKLITPDNDNNLDAGIACCIPDNRPPGNHVLKPESQQPLSNHTADEHENIDDVIDKEKVPRVSKRQRSDSPSGINSHCYKKRQKRSPLPIPENDKDDRASSINYDLYWMVREIIGERNVDGSPSGSSDETSDVETPSKPRALTQQSNAGQIRSVKTSQAAEESDVRHRQYCTQACLLGLVRKRPLDDACPNVNAHRAHKTSNYHALGRKSLIKFMSRQLAENPDNGCEPLGKQSACGALFRLTLEWYRYTFVAKGTVTAFEAKLKHEGLVYQHLNEVQGELIPVYLGNISLVYPYFLNVGVRIVHMLLMSWAGEQAHKDLLLAMGRDLAAETNGAVAKMLDCGVEHRDVRPPNVLWNSEGQKVILVDFERSEILKQMPILQEISPNRKRKHLYLADTASCSGQHHHQRFISHERYEAPTAPIFAISVLEYFKQSSTKDEASRADLLRDDDGKYEINGEDPRLFFDIVSPSSTFICGSQGLGKSHTLSCLLENCLTAFDAPESADLLSKGNGK
ncbi:hypothetical protein HYALB_00000666 [Hymenoscyphus albidus]|uniref:Protein kinase domain-containing protein n=1 Tax=Hymenoscyphus albidus TaxID=595503 RepID=A0A9N9LRC1_9HELO|nr:hypothetical protein HYALB_00000666 [Hymenoscyphus albidus]